MRDKEITSKERLEHIIESFLNNLALINGVLFQFAIIGEAVMHVDHKVLEKYSYPWYKVRGFRNFIVHEYHAIEFRIVWEAAKKGLA